MISVLATISIKPGSRDEFIRLFNANVPAVLAEEGCIEYFPAIDIESGIEVQSSDENAVVVIEKWESLDHLRAHLVAPHMQAYKEATKDMVTGLSLKILQKA
ncbi:MAG: putative quinol monooxygenase [Planctomycetota bacterium]